MNWTWLRGFKLSEIISFATTGAGLIRLNGVATKDLSHKLEGTYQLKIYNA